MSFDIITENIGNGRWILYANKTLFIHNGHMSIFQTDIQVGQEEKFIIKSSGNLLNKRLFISGDFIDENGYVYVAIYNSNIVSIFDREKLIFGPKKETLIEKFCIGELIEI